LAIANFANDCSSSRWPTPNATDGEKAPNHYSRGPDNPSLPTAARLWPAMTAGSSERGADLVRRDTGNPNSDLPTRVAMWPGPDAQVMNDREEPETFIQRKAAQQELRRNGDGMGTPLAMAVKMWPAPISRDHRSGYAADETLEGNARPLSEFAVSMWRTPTATDPKRGDRPDWTPDKKAGEHSLNRQSSLWSTLLGSDSEKGSPNQCHGPGGGGTPLTAQVARWKAPRTARGPYTRDKGNPDLPRLTLEGQADHFSLPDPIKSLRGEISSSDRRRLNPQFVEYLMGWPDGWTIVSIACASLETELSHFRARMRSAFLQLALPADLPAQLGLFG
jgi:cytochrome c5